MKTPLKILLLLVLLGAPLLARADITFTPLPVVVTAGGTIPAGKQHIEFILSTDFVGTIAGCAMTGSGTLPLGVWTPGETYGRGSFSAVTYTISAGSAIITTW